MSKKISRVISTGEGRRMSKRISAYMLSIPRALTLLHYHQSSCSAIPSCKEIVMVRNIQESDTEL